MGRFINADDDSVFEEEEDGGQLLYNLYAYSNNNPVNMEDSEGDIAWFAVQALFAAPDIYKAIKNPSLKNFKNVATNFIPFAKVGKMGFKTFKVTKKLTTSVKVGTKYKVTKKTLKPSQRKINISKQFSRVWNNFKSVKNSSYKTSGTGKSKRYYGWDFTHNDIEVYDSKGKHLGSMSPITGKMYKGAVKGRKIKI